MSHEREDVPFYEIAHAVADDVGNIYCAGTLPTAPPANGDEPSSFYTTVDGRKLPCIDGIWSYDAELRPRSWRREGGAIGWLALHEPGRIAVYMDEGYANRPFVIRAEDGELGDGPQPQLRGFRRVLLDRDGSYVALAQEEEVAWSLVRISPAKGFGRVPLFEPTGFFARMLASDRLSLDGVACFALARDGDLVTHSEQLRRSRHFQRFDRSGRRLLDVPSPLEGFAQQATLVAGRDGIVWAWRKGRLCALTRDAVIADVLTAGMGEGLGPALAALPDGTLVFFGDDGRIARATTKGARVTSFEVLSAR